MNHSDRLTGRYLLCTPHGGMNDTFCQIAKCLAYAERFSRTLIIDTRQSGLMGQFSDFFNIFSKKSKVIPCVSAGLLKQLNYLDCQPITVKGNLLTLQLLYSEALGNFVEKNTGTPITFDFHEDHHEQLLVHEQCGGGNASLGLLSRISIVPSILYVVRENIDVLPQSYIGIHIRNTDHKTAYQGFFKTIYKHTVGKKVLVCSDNPEMISKAASYFNLAEIFTATKMTNVGGEALHLRTTFSTNRERKLATVNAISDLVALGSADDVLFANVVAGYPSGFSRLAKFLSQNKSLIRCLLSEPTWLDRLLLERHILQLRIRWFLRHLR